MHVDLHWRDYCRLRVAFVFMVLPNHFQSLDLLVDNVRYVGPQS